MKRLLVSLIALSATLLMASCAKEQLLPQESGSEASVSFMLGLQNSLQTKAIGDGTGADHLKYVVFDVNGNRIPGIEIFEEDVEFLEHIIDREEGVLPPWKGFILPGGTRAAAVAHVCRTVCRRTERCILALAETTEIDRVIIEYVNRLSDYFYVLARKLNFMAGVDEILWQKRCSFEK